MVNGTLTALIMEDIPHWLVTSDITVEEFQISTT